MHELNIKKQLQSFITLAKDSGFEIRHELLDGIGSSICEVRGRKCLFLDVSCGPAEQLESIKATLQTHTK